MNLAKIGRQNVGINSSESRTPKAEPKDVGDKTAPDAHQPGTSTWWVFYGTAAGILILDQICKLALVARMSEGQSQPLVGPYVSLTVHHNPGAAFGLFPTGTVGLAILAAVVIIILVLYGPRATRCHSGLSVALGLTLGGAAGNLIDRARLGYVIDFIDIHFWPVFNIADIAITCGAIMLVLSVLRKSSRRTAL